jgi:LPXTG-site transpeptidase (sortase) family protein
MTGKPNPLKELRKVFLFFIFSFLSIFLVLNIIQFFNFMSKQVSTLVETNPQISPQVLPVTINLSEQKEFPLTEKENSLEIQKLGLEVPLVFAKSVEIKDMKQDLNNGVVVYPGSSLPGQEGKLIVLGHSAPPGWPKIRYDWVFSKLAELEAGDNILINFNHYQYSFKINNKIFLEKGQAIPENDSDGSKEFLYLVTCWPPGKDFKRLVVESELVLTE